VEESIMSESTVFCMQFIFLFLGIFSLYCFVFYFLIPRGRKQWWAIRCPKCNKRGVYVGKLWKGTLAERENILEYRCVNPNCWKGKLKSTYLYDFVWYRYITSDQVDK
jgi:hypothetical protein